MGKRLLFSMSQKDIPNKGRFTIPTSVGSGSIKTVFLNSGIRLALSDYELNQPTVLKYFPNAPFFGFGFCLSGEVEMCAGCLNRAFSVTSGQSALYSFPTEVDFTETVGREHVVKISVMIPFGLLHAFTGGEIDRLPTALENLSKGPGRVTGVITPLMRMTLHQILNCPYDGLTRDLFMESKILELAAYKIEQLDTDNNLSARPSVMKPDDIDRVRHAAHLLGKDLEDPPDLNKLARSVGMCRSKLHHCFRSVYGITPFDYLRNRRLETAASLLNEGKTNVTEAACAVGYASLSHFSKAFRDHFGFPPATCLKDATFFIK